MKLHRLKESGFTFLEMALGLFILGFMLVAVPRLVSQGQATLQAAPGATPVDAAELNLTGFVLRNFRLPCPAALPTSGVEDCSLSKGFVPYRSLGLGRPATNSEGQPMGYAILRDAANNNDLGALSHKYTPQYLDTVNSYEQATTTAVSSLINGLDFCAKLRDAAVRYQPANATLTGVRHVRNAAVGVNVAWVLVDPGARNADGAAVPQNKVFDGINDPLGGSAWFESPSRSLSETYDDTVRAGTFAQLFGELHCVELLSAMSAAAREADFAFDAWRVRKFLYDFRSYELDVRRQKKIQADNLLLMATFDKVLTGTLATLDLAVALGGGAGAGEIAVAVVNAIASVSMSNIGKKAAEKAVNDAIDEVTEGQQRLATSATDVTNATAFLTQRRNSLIQLDQRGWFQ